MQADPTAVPEGIDIIHECPLDITCQGHSVPAILTSPSDATLSADTAILIIVGGPQYRVGSHRQFVQLARALARAGLTALRFDFRGMGDANGDPQTFEDGGPDLRSAIDCLLESAPHVRRVVLWGLCDAASVALMHGTSHPAVAGVVLANPWVRSTTSIAAVTLKHYYLARLRQSDFWKKLLGGRFDWHASLSSLLGIAGRLIAAPLLATRAETDDFQTRMALGLAAFDGPVLLLLSGDDLTAREFVEYTASAVAWRGLLDTSRVRRIDLAEADHTFSRRVWKTQVEEATISWIQSVVRTASAQRLQPSSAASSHKAS